MRVAVWWSILVAAAIGATGPARATEAELRAAAPRRPILEIWKGERRMELREGDEIIRRFPIVLGRAPRYAKEQRGDLRTPVGRYYISHKKHSRFHRFLGISYPNVEDAERGYQRGLIDAGQWADIFFANLSGEMPTASTRLGGWVGIHGFGHRAYAPIDWTEGCIAVSNEEIEYLFDVTPIGTPVIINE